MICQKNTFAIIIINHNPKKWKVIGNGIYPIDKMGGAERFGEGICKCYNNKNKELPILWINTKNGTMHFNPSKLRGNLNLIITNIMIFAQY